MNKPCFQTRETGSPALQDELRVVIRFLTIDIPDSAAERAQRVVNDYAISHLHRPFSWDIDHIHYSPDFDSEIPKQVWIMGDFNIRKQCTHVDDIPIKCVQACYTGGNGAVREACP